MSVLAKAVQVIEELGAAESPIKLGTISEAVHLPKSSAHRLLNELADLGLVTRCAEGEYTVGFRLHRWGSFDRDRVGLRAAAEPVMRRLRDEVNESVMLIGADGPYRVCLAIAPSNHMMRPALGVGDRSLMGMGAAGKLLFAYADATVRQQVIDLATGPERASLAPAAELEQIRLQGWASSIGELESDLTAFAVPIPDGEGGIVAALLVAGASSRMSPDDFEAVRDLMQRSAEEISTPLLGARKPLIQ